MFYKFKASLRVGFVIYNCLKSLKIVFIEPNVTDRDMEKLRCKYCENTCVKNGTHSNGKQRYRCCVCKKRQLKEYSYNAYHPELNQKIITLTKEGLGIRSTARVLRISATTLLKRIISIAGKIPRPIISKGKVYEVDELRTYLKIKTKLIWVVYALERKSKRIVSFNVGSRTNKTLKLF